jgi:Flp pilus assembly protein TadG
MRFSGLRDIRDQQGGTVAILFGLIAAVLFGTAGFAVDYSRAVSLQARMQQALDAAVIAGLKVDTYSRTKTATEVFEQNMAGTDVKLGLKFKSDSADQFTGTATTHLPSTIAAAIGVFSLPVNATSTAAMRSSGKVCILVLDKTASQAFLVNGGADVDAPECEVHVHSTANPAAIFNSGTNIDSKRICIKGSSIIDNGGSHPNMKTACEPAADPYVGRYPEPASAACNFSNLNFNGGNVRLSPGVYCGWTNFNNAPNVTLDPGVYVVKGGGWNVNGGTWTGNDVTFYFADTSKIQFNSAVAAQLTPPSSGAYENVIIFEKSGLARSPFVLDDSRGFDIKGLVYLPSRDTIFNGGTSVTSKDFTIVVNTLILDQTRWKLDSSSTEISTGGSDGAVRLIN